MPIYILIRSSKNHFLDIQRRARPAAVARFNLRRDALPACRQSLNLVSSGAARHQMHWHRSSGRPIASLADVVLGGIRRGARPPWIIGCGERIWPRRHSLVVPRLRGADEGGCRGHYRARPRPPLRRRHRRRSRRAPHLDPAARLPSLRPLPRHRRRRLRRWPRLAPRPQDLPLPVKALAKLVRGKLTAALAGKRPDLAIPNAAWRKPWVVHCTPWGEGEQAMLDYLGRYVFRVAVTNARLFALDDMSSCATANFQPPHAHLPI
jgi:hypothetical protein